MEGKITAIAKDKTWVNHKNQIIIIITREIKYLPIIFLGSFYPYQIICHIYFSLIIFIFL